MRENRWTWTALLLLGAVALLYFLSSRFPGAMADGDAKMRLLYGLGWFALIASSVAVGWRERAGIALRQALAWVAIAMGLVIAYGYKDDFMGLGQTLVGQLIPSQPVSTEPSMAYLSRDLNGHFGADALVNGTHVHFMVDTGASDIALTTFDAERLGFDPTTLNYSIPYSTANGTTYAARITLKEVEVGNIKIDNVVASVSRGGLDGSLLGMSFLERLGSFEIKGDRLVLRQ